MSLFIDWNTLLLEEYFSSSKVDQKVWISTTRHELEGIGVHLGGCNGLVEAVKQGPPWFHGDGDVYSKARWLVRQRNWPSLRPDEYIDPEKQNKLYEDRHAPTYMPYIALWVLAGSEVDTLGFYEKVKELSGSPYPKDTRENMEEVWKDLEKWSSTKTKGELGQFSVNILGSHKYVGMAYAQALVTHRDIAGISRLFGSCRLNPGQTLNTEHFDQLLKHGQNSYFLSKGLKHAMGDPNYREHLRELLGSYLDFWDGTVPKRASPKSNPTVDLKKNNQLFVDDLSIILQMKFSQDSTFWEIGWRLPALEAGFGFSLSVDGNNEESAKLELAGTHLFCINIVNQKAVRELLNRSATETIESKLNFIGIDGDINDRKFILREDKIRILTWDSPDPALRDCLIEREMPVSGPVYLLYSQLEYSNLIHFLKNEDIDHQIVDFEGIADKWALICIEDSSLLTTEQRASIIDEEISNTPKARIRLVGGKPIIGAGNKKYAFYDLPIIELEAPPKTQLNCSDLIFEELIGSQKNSIRRFKLSLKEEKTCVMKITASLGGEEICKISMQILLTGGLGVGKRDQFSLDNFGRAIFDSSGLLGATIGEKQASNNGKIDCFQIDQKTLNDLEDKNISEYMQNNISALFLDSIASSTNGSISYGAARDQVRRLAVEKGIDNIEPALLLRELRLRGHIEIETNEKGHMVRICSVPPTIYSVPIKDNKLQQLYGVCGSLRLQHWHELSLIVGCKIFFDKGTPPYLPTLRLAPFTELSVIAFANFANFQVVDFPSLSLSQWVGSINERKKNLMWYQEQGLSPNYLKKLNPTKGWFSDTRDILVDPELKYELFKYEDHQIQGLSVYKLGENLGEGLSKYSFIQDSRWGVWMAINAFAEFVKNAHGISDASPWPLHYDSKNGSLYLPARMEPPLVVERLLILSSGESPKVIKASGKHEGNLITLIDNNLKKMGRVSLVYEHMANGKWLCYRWVPRKIAARVATLLNGELQDFHA